MPGEEAQVDWFFYRHPDLGKLCGFAYVLSYSRVLFAHLYPRHSFEFFIDGHLRAFEALGGFPRALRFDNLKSVVLKKTPLSYNPAFLEFAHYYGFDIRLCNLACGNEKGRVERAIRSLRETFLNIADTHQSLGALNQALSKWVQNKNENLHRATGKTPYKLKEEENLKPLPQNPWPNRLILPEKPTTKTGLVIFDNNRYSVPDYLTGQLLTLYAYCDHLEIYDEKGKKVATHPRQFCRGQTFESPQHRSFGKISAQAKRDRIYRVIQNLDPVIEEFLCHNEAVGEDPYDTAYQIFRILRDHARQTIFSAIREALQRKMPRLKFLTTLLAAPEEADQGETLAPQNPSLLTLDYKARNLEDYEDHENGTK